jgi:hypothetical protein
MSIKTLLDNNSAIITPHTFSPLPNDGFNPTDKDIKDDDLEKTITEQHKNFEVKKTNKKIRNSYSLFSALSIGTLF